MVQLSRKGDGVSLFAGQDRESMREAWRIAWRRQRDRLPLTPLQTQMAAVIALHPEHQGQFAENPDGSTADEAAGRAYLHLALHLALHEQLSTDRPRGIARIHTHLATRCGDRHEAEHRMIGVLDRSLWEAQRTGRMPDEAHYFEALRRL
jgi:Domain of unknown function (DUF1841)